MNGHARSFSGGILILLACFLVGCGTNQTGSAPAQAPGLPPPPSAAVPLHERVDVAIRNAVGEDGQTAIKVNQVDGTILLTGQVLTEEDKASASNAAAFTGGGDLRRLVNELRVVDQIDAGSAETDEQLAASIANSLTAANPSLGGRVAVVAENARVFLLGRVSRAEGDEAAQLASRQDGVESVRTVFDYTD